MKANKFVEKFGWDAAKEALTLACDKLEHVNYENNAVLISDLKRLVESRELVEYIGNDLDGAKQVYAFTKDCVHIAMRDRMIPVIRLKQAIADVESCNENPN